MARATTLVEHLDDLAFYLRSTAAQNGGIRIQNTKFLNHYSRSSTPEAGRDQKACEPLDNREWRCRGILLSKGARGGRRMIFEIGHPAATRVQVVMESKRVSKESYDYIRHHAPFDTPLYITGFACVTERGVLSLSALRIEAYH